MKRAISTANWWQIIGKKSGIVTLTILTILAGLIVNYQPAKAQEQRNLIARRMIELQQSSDRWISIDLTDQSLFG
ncbi:MAG: hypothetical protein F6K35_25905 [Okeania sp. SIO2H7]|nr:hypothetical protein [Okeania sp. SIO2H7]